MKHGPGQGTIDTRDRLTSLATRRAGGDGLVALAASAGGLSALSRVLAGLPASFSLPVVVVQHLNPDHRSHLAELLSRHTPLRVKNAEDDERVAAGTVYVACKGRHLLVTATGRLQFSDAAPVHFVRPAADLLFASIAASYSERSIVVVLSGTGVDGSDGVREIRRSGGTVIVQDSEDAEFPGMPESAVATRCVDIVLPLDEIANALVILAA